MVRYGKTTLQIDAPIIIVQDGTAVWTDSEWPKLFFNWVEKEKIKLRGVHHGNGHLILKFENPEDLTLFGLKYDEKKIF